MTRCAFISLASAFVVASMLAPSASAAPKAPGQPSSSEKCAWPWAVGVQDYNVGIPGSAAAYWAQPIVGGPSTSITASGTYPGSRYFSLSVYTPYGTPFSVNGVGSSLPDYRIAPEQGSTNPWQHRAAPGGSYRVTVRSAAAPGEPNMLPLPSGTSALQPGYLVYRVYLPEGASLAHLKLPTISVAQGSVSRSLPACRTQEPFTLPEKAPGGTVPAPKKTSVLPAPSTARCSPSPGASPTPTPPTSGPTSSARPRQTCSS